MASTVITLTAIACAAVPEWKYTVVTTAEPAEAGEPAGVSGG